MSVPTAEEFLDNFLNKEAIPWNPEIDKVYGCINIAMIEFAKLHVTAALEAASDTDILSGISYKHRTNLDMDAILNSYPLENIK